MTESPPSPPSPPRTNAHVLAHTVELAGKRVVDVGCGEGALTRYMAQKGAQVIGVEPSLRQLAKAQAAEPVSNELIIQGGAESLPVDDDSVDLVVFFNSLHHIPRDLMAQALREAARALKPGGAVYVCEPVAEGTYFDLVKPIDDETAVRALAYATIDAAEEFGLVPGEEMRYAHEVRHRSFERFREKIISANEEREGAFAAQDQKMRARFLETAEQDEDGAYVFEQPMRVNLLHKPTE